MNISTAFKIPEPLFYWWALGSFLMLHSCQSHVAAAPRFLSSNPPHQMAIIHPFFSSVASIFTSSVSSGALLAANALPPEARGPVFRCMVWAAINADDADAAKRWVKKSGDIMSGSKIYEGSKIGWYYDYDIEWFTSYNHTNIIYYILYGFDSKFEEFWWISVGVDWSPMFTLATENCWIQDAVGFIVHDLLLAHDLAQVAEWLLTISSRCLQLHDHPGRERQDTGEQRKQEKTTKGPTNHDTSW